MTKGRRKQAGALRIVGGDWRGSRVGFPADALVRPTPDRVRETLFNWLAPWLPGARCLDLFAGTGALGLEALSRGAAAVTFVERDRALTSNIEQTLERLGGTAGKVLNQDAWRYLDDPGGPWDLVFLDPPFDCERLGDLCTLLCNKNLLLPRGWVYVEYPLQKPPQLDQRLGVHRQGKAGQVGFRLLRLTDIGDE